MRAFKPKNLAQKRALSRSASPQQDHRLSRLDVQVQPVQHTASIVLNDEIADGDDRHQCFPVK